MKIGLGLGLVGLLLGTASAEVRVGFAEVDITPEGDVPMAGYYHARYATGVHDPLFAKAMVIESGSEKAALVGLDLINTNRSMVERARELVAARSGIDGPNVMISATHAHTGPVLVKRSARENALGGASAKAVAYLESLMGKIAESVALAEKNLQVAKVSVGSVDEGAVAFNRRFHMKDGGFGWNAGKLNPNILRAAGPIDPEVPVVWVEDAKGKVLGSYVNYACHLDTVGGTEISADYPATVADLVRGVVGEDAVTVFTIGCAGDINHIDVSWGGRQKGNEEAARIGTVLGGAVIKTWPIRQGVAEGAVRVRSEMVELGLPEITEEELKLARRSMLKGTDDRAMPFREVVKMYKVLDIDERKGKPHSVEVQVVALGSDVAWVSLPGEVFVELGLAIKKASPFKQTIIAELANGSVGYIPTRQAYAQGEYEVISTRVAAGGGEKLVEVATGMLREVFKEQVAK